MEDKKIIAEALLDLAKNSSTTFIEVAEDKELIEAAKKIGIVLPSPDLAVLKTVYAEIDKVNRNGVVLPRDAVEKGLPTLIGKQINWEHDGAGRVCGYTIDAKINEDKIEIIGVVFKSLFPEEMDLVKTKFEDKKLAVSFEIWNRNPANGKSVVHELSNGFRAIDPITFHGTGLLMTNQPACPKAFVYKLLASKELENAEQIVDKIFEEDLICASMAIEEPKCKNCTSCTCEKEVQIVEEIKIEEVLENDKTIETIVVEQSKDRLCPECQEPMQDDDVELCAKCKTKKEKSSEETQAEVKPEETKTEEKSEVAETKPEEIKAEETIEEVKVEETPKVEAEIKVEEPKVEEKTEEKKTEAEIIGQPVEVKVKKLIKNVTLDGTEVTELFGDAGSTISKKRKTIFIRYFDDGTEERNESEAEAIEIYTYSQMEEKDKEIANLKEELGKKDQEIAELKNPIVEEKREKVMTVGSVDVEVKSEIKEQAENINKIIANKGEK